jgi:hypothetical protein
MLVVITILLPPIAITNENHLHYYIVVIACKLFDKMSQQADLVSTLKYCHYQ